LAAYPSVEVVKGVVDSIGGGFVVSVGDRSFSARTVLLATGLLDELPAIEGFGSRWGVSVLHCPFCHGWEVRDRPWAIVGNGASILDLCTMAKNWTSQVSLCTNGLAELSEDELFSLEANGIVVYEDDIVRVEGGGTAVERLVFADGGGIECGAVFFRPSRVQRSALAVELGCAHTEAGFVSVDERGQTSLRGVFAAGDCIEPSMQILSVAAASGARAGVAIAKALFAEDFGAGK